MEALEDENKNIKWTCTCGYTKLAYEKTVKVKCELCRKWMKWKRLWKLTERDKK